MSIAATSDDHKDHDESDEQEHPGDDSTDNDSADDDFVPINDDESSDGKSRFIITGDNLDKNIKPRFMTVDHQTQSLHCFHAFAALNHSSFIC